MGVASSPRGREGSRWAFLASERPDPRVLQSIIATFVAIDVVSRHLAGDGYPAASWPGIGLLVYSTATLLAFFVPWQRAPLWTLATLPVADVVALGMTRLGPTGSGPSFLVLLPTVWLAWQFGRRGVVLAVGLVASLQAAPTLLYRGLDGTAVSRGVLLPLFTGMAGMAVALGLETVLARNRELEERERQLRGTLDEIEHRKELNQAVLDTVDVGVVVLGRDGAYLSTNRQHQAFMALGFPQGHGGAAGQPGDVFGEDGTTRMSSEEMASARAMRGEEFEDRRIWAGADPATRRAFSVSARTMRDAEGRFAGAVLTYTDITDLLSALQVKDEFVATVSHELRTPLTSILGYVDLLRERDDLDQRTMRHLDVVDRNGRRLLHVVDDLLRTAQLAGGQSGLALETDDLARLAREAVAAARPAADGAGVRLTARLPERMPAQLDPERIGQVIDNLLSNALKYNRPRGCVTVLLTGDGRDALLEVRDSGPGLTPEECHQVFARFYRARHAVDHAIPGAGLGLSITQAIVDAHAGSIEFESEVDVGTVVRVRLPRLAPDPRSAPDADAVAGTAVPPGLAVGRG